MDAVGANVDADADGVNAGVVAEINTFSQDSEWAEMCIRTVHTARKRQTKEEKALRQCCKIRAETFACVG